MVQRQQEFSTTMLNLQQSKNTLSKTQKGRQFIFLFFSFLFFVVGGGELERYLPHKLIFILHFGQPNLETRKPSNVNAIIFLTKSYGPGTRASFYNVIFEK